MCRFVNDINGLLVASDVAARGLDIPHVQHIIHYQIPKSPEVCFYTYNYLECGYVGLCTS